MAKILVVDDDATLRALLAGTLKRAGYDVEQAADGRQAVRAYRASPADLVLTDMFMPEMDGMEAIMMLRREFPDVRIVVMSGGAYFGTSDILEMAEQLGAARTLAKPIESEDLLRAVEAVLREEG
jgi:CheY-like chemotaxis protein